MRFILFFLPALAAAHCKGKVKTETVTVTHYASGTRHHHGHSLITDGKSTATTSFPLQSTSTSLATFETRSKTSTASPAKASSTSPTTTKTKKTSTAAVLDAVSTTSTTVCAEPQASVLIPDSDLLVGAYLFHEDRMVEGASLCSGYYGTSDDNVASWETIFNIPDDDVFGDKFKGYSCCNVIGDAINTQLGDIASIPAVWNWEFTNTTEWMGDIIYDFMFAPTKNDRSSAAVVELMLYIDYSDQLGFIGQDNGVVDTISLFGLDGWSLYWGQANAWWTATLVAPKEARYNGHFEGDILDWVKAMKDVSGLQDSWFCTTATSGLEAFHGDIKVKHATKLKVETK